MRNVVFAVAESGHDLSKTSAFGELRYLFGKDAKINIYSTDALQETISRKLEDAEEDDFLVLTGNTTACCIAYCCLMKKFSKVNLLIYSFRGDEYELRTIRDR